MIITYLVDAVITSQHRPSLYELIHTGINLFVGISEACGLGSLVAVKRVPDPHPNREMSAVLKARMRMLLEGQLKAII